MCSNTTPMPSARSTAWNWSGQPVDQRCSTWSRAGWRRSPSCIPATMPSGPNTAQRFTACWRTTVLKCVSWPRPNSATPQRHSVRSTQTRLGSTPSLRPIDMRSFWPPVADACHKRQRWQYCLSPPTRDIHCCRSPISFSMPSLNSTGWCRCGDIAIR